MANSPQYPDLVNNTQKQNEYALITMTLLGTGEIIGAPLFGTVRDQMGNKVAIVFITILSSLAISSVLYLNYENQWSYVAKLMNLFWGL